MTPTDSSRKFNLKGFFNTMNNYGDDKKNGLLIPIGIVVLVSGLILNFLFGTLPTRVSCVEQVQATQKAEIHQLQADSQELKNDVKTIKEDVGYIRGVLESQQRRNGR